MTDKLSSKNEISESNYKSLLGDIVERIRESQYNALKAVNKELISLYWDIGKMIVERQKNESWGNLLFKNLLKIFGKNSQISEDFLLKISGICVSSFLNIEKMKNSNHLLEKLVGLITLLFWVNVKMI
jgi:hypothetical protein